MQPLRSALASATVTDLTFEVEPIRGHSADPSIRTGYLLAGVSGRPVPRRPSIAYVHGVDGSRQYWYVVVTIVENDPEILDAADEHEALEVVLEAARRIYSPASPSPAS